MKAIVVGAGLMGTPLAYAMVKLGYQTSIMELNVERKNQAVQLLKGLGTPVHAASSNLNMLKDHSGRPDVVVSAAPFHANEEIASWALSNGIRYCDLGGDPDTSDAIRKKSLETGIAAFTDLGLAPGMINLMAEKIVQSRLSQGKSVRSVKMRVGGLPVNPTGQLKYARTWSTDGLINEYSGYCHHLVNGEHIERPALGDKEEVYIGNQKFEAFNTKGGFATTLYSMAQKGVLNANYKTLRYPGHVGFLKFLIEDCEMSSEEFDRVIQKTCPVTRQDIVYQYVSVDEEIFYAVVKHDHNWTAMQQSTAFPAAAAADIIAKGSLDQLAKEGVVPSYADIDYNLLSDNLAQIGSYFPNYSKGL